MPGKVKVRILAGRNLPVMDKSSDTSDAFAEVKLGNTTYKTEVFRRSLNPYWNSEWFRFEADDEDLQDEPLQIRIMDYDTYSANDAIGKVYIDLNPLLHKDSGHIMFGWFPIYDTMHGIRGEVHLAVKVDLFSDSNRYRQSSCGVRFFYSPGVPNNYVCQAVLGFVEELVVNDDPEYQWIDKIRTPRASNEARQTLFSKLSGEVQRKIGLKALDLGGNAVIGYKQCFDLEGESGIVVRGIGTAVILVKTDVSSIRRHHTFGSTPTGAGTKVDEYESHSFYSNCILKLVRNVQYLRRFCAFLDSSCNCLCFFLSSFHQILSFYVLLWLRLESNLPGLLLKSWYNLLLEQPKISCSELMSQCCLSPLLDGSSFFEWPSQQTSSVYWPSCHVVNPSASPPIPPVAFLSHCDISSSYPCCFSRTSSPSPSATLRSSPVPFGSNTPKFSQWLNKLAKSVATPVPQRKYLSGTSTLPRAKSLKVATRSEIELTSLVKSSNTSSKGSNGSGTTHKWLTKNVQAHAVLSRHNSFDIPAACSSNTSASAQVKDLACKSATQISTTTSHPLVSIVRFPTANSVASEDHSHNFTTCKASSLLSCSPSEPTGTPITPMTAPPVIYPIVPLTTPFNGTKLLTTSPKSAGTVIHRRGSSDPDLSTTPNCGSNQSSGSGSAGNKSGYKFIISPEGIHLLEYPFITMKQLPVGLIQHIGGVVSSRSVKILDQINNPDDPETRDAWWMELRKEVRSHCRALSCNAVLGYSESTNICDEVVVLSASGTAVLLNTEKEKRDLDQTPHSVKIPTKPESSNRVHTPGDMAGQHANCSLCHIPYSESMVPFPSSLSKCGVCRKAKVPDVLFMTIEPPVDISITGIGCLIQARVCRYKRDSKGEQCAKEISDSLPFLEYELHRQLLSKLKMKGMNGIFGLTVQISVGDNLLIALATGTGAFINALPPPLPPQISSGKGVDTAKLTEIQKLITENINKNREHYGLPSMPSTHEQLFEIHSSTVPTKEDLQNENVQPKTPSQFLEPLGLQGESPEDVDVIKKGQVLLEVDDTEDADIISLMIDADIPEGYEVCNTEVMPGLGHLYVCSLQTFSQVYRAKLNTCKQFAQQFDWIVQSLFVKLRRLVPCCLADLKFTVDLPEADLVQLTVMGSVVGLGGTPLSKSTLGGYLGTRKRAHSVHEHSDELLFSMDEDHKSNDGVNNVHSAKESIYHVSPIEHTGVELTPLSFIPDGHIHYYLGNLDFFFIRESTSIRESGGLNGFMHSFLSEVFAIVRAHVAALGGNAMTALHLTQCVLLYNPHKNQAQCLVNIAGDAVMVHYNNAKTAVGFSKLHSELNANESIISEENENYVSV